MQTYANRGKGDYVTANICFPYNFFKYFFHKLLAIITRFFVGFDKISALLKISVLRNYISLLFFVWFIIIPDC